MINKISILGLGLIGGSLAKALKACSRNIHIAAFDLGEVCLQALQDNVIDEKLETLEDSLSSDLIILCMPLNESLEAFDLLAPRLKKDTLLSDVCGVKGVFEEKWQTIDSEGLYIGGHPMTGKEKGGYLNSDPLLFENAVYILTNKYRNNKLADEFVQIIRQLGSHIAFLDADRHDSIISYVSHLPQLLSIALVNSADKTEDNIKYLDFAAGGFRDMTRIASSSYNIWRDVINLNKREITMAIKDIQMALEKMKRAIEESDLDMLASEFKRANRSRNEIPKNTKGFLNPLYDLFVYVEDRPGIISRISTVLYENGINIKDIELLKIREGSGGTFRLSFETQSEVIRASELLNSKGFEAKEN